MRFLQSVARRVAEMPDDWLSKAEAIGKVDLDTRWDGCRAAIVVGDYHDVHLRVTGHGDSSGAALRCAVEKALPILEALASAGKP